VRVESLFFDGDATQMGRHLRALAPTGAAVAADVAAIVARVRDGGDAALQACIERFDRPAAPPAPLDPDVEAGLGVAIANVRAVAEAQVGTGTTVTLPQGHTVEVRERPVRRAAIYVPGGRNPYPSTVVMGVVTAQVAGVEEVVVCAPGMHSVVAATCDLLGVGERYAMGGAHAIAALTYGTETIPRVDVIAGPGGLWVQEAKRQVSGDVGIDGFLGPSDLLICAGEGVDHDLVLADLRAQGEHGEGSVVALLSSDDALLAHARDELAAFDTPAVGATVLVDDPRDAIAVANAFAPEHLELVGASMEALVDEVRNAGCTFVGASGGTAFGDYVAGSNHSLPTGGSARFASALGPRTFRRRASVVRIGDATDALARAGSPIARAEGFGEHARSMTLRQNQES
jgi:histidinol dehydrogenase